MAFALLSPVAIGSSVVVVTPQKANAGAPVMAMPKMKQQDPAQTAFELHDRKLMAEAQKELAGFQQKAKEIEESEGTEARIQFEKEYRESQSAKAEAFRVGLENLKRNLLDQGIHPYLDIEGQRQVILYEKGVDLGEVDGTKFNLERRNIDKGSENTFAFRKKSNREIIKALVKDLKNREIDPLVYFERNDAKADTILSLPADKAALIASQYRANLELYGQITRPQEVEKGVKEIMATTHAAKKKTKENSKEEQKQLKAGVEAKVAKEKAEAKAAAKAKKDQQRNDKQASKAAAKAAKQQADAVVTTVAAPTNLEATVTELGISEDIVDNYDSLPHTTSHDIDDSIHSSSNNNVVGSTDVPSSRSKMDKSGGFKLAPASGVMVSLGVGAYVVKVQRDSSAAKEAERLRQLKILMGEADADKKNKVGSNILSDSMYKYESMTEKDNDAKIDEDEDDDTEVDSSERIQPSPPKPKKLRGLKYVFRRGGNDREVDLSVLVAPEAKAPEFSKAVAKILTFGAPGRFPDVISLPGEMPLDNFDIERASTKILEKLELADISREESAEVFANIVNCMLIDIVDLASTCLKENDQQITTNALAIVISFMDLAAQLYASIFDGIYIDPVTYGGDLSKKKLEQMYSTYAMSGMMDMSNIDEKFDDRVSLLQDVFQISPKRAEGLMTKAMQKNLMEMLKSGKMPDGMEDMMKGMEEIGLPGMNEEPDPGQMKEMLQVLKDLKNSGSLPVSELNEVKKQFKEMFGSSIEEIMKNAGNDEKELGKADKELLDLMKSILD